MELTDLNHQQKEAVTHGEGPLLIIAGAGTGKTEVITRRIAYLIDSGMAKPEEILALTFTEKAATEMEERVDLLLPYGTVGTRIMTFHAFGESLLREYGLDIGLDLNFNLLSKAQQIIFLKDHLDELKLEYFTPVSDPTSYLEALVNYFSRLRDELVKPAQYLELGRKMLRQASDEQSKLEAVKQKELARAYDTYQQLKRQNSVIDFGDQINLAIELFKNRPNVLQKVRHDARFILVDEFQDTNFAQNYLLELLGGKNGNITVVGDDDQSIYKFRGAAISNILNFKQAHPKAVQIVLTHNYRSSQAILDAAYSLIQHNNPDRLEHRNQINKCLRASRNGTKPGFLISPHYALESDMIARDVARRIKHGSKAGSMAVLIRKRSQALAITTALRSLAIPYQYHDLADLYEQPEIQLMVSFLKYLVDPADSVSLYHLLASEAFRAPLSELATAAGTARRRNQSLEEILRSQTTGSTEFLNLLSKFWIQADHWRELTTYATVGQISYDFLRQTGYVDDLVKRSQADASLEGKIKHLSQFFRRISEYEQIASDRSVLGYVSALGWLPGLTGVTESAEMELNLDEVQVLTIHQAKGLEFETVYLFDLTQGSLPSYRRPQAIDMPLELLGQEVLPSGNWHLQEERRLMYVAMTRAKNRLILSYSPDHGGKFKKKPSIFIQEALGINPADLRKPESTPLQQIELFRLNGSDSASVIRPRFWLDHKLVLTPHQIDDYLTCPENFRCRHILEIPEPPNPALMYGSLIHDVINFYFSQVKSGQKVTLNNLLDLVPLWWRSEGFASAGQEAKRLKMARATIKRFWQREEAARRPPTYIEREFEFELPEHQVIVRGRWDAVYLEPDKKVEIRDFKTSQVESPDKASQKAANSVQLAIYALAWQRLRGQAPHKVVLDYVDTGQIGESAKSELDLKATVRQIGQVARGIRNGDFEASGNCRYCIHQRALKVGR